MLTRIQRNFYNNRIIANKAKFRSQVLFFQMSENLNQNQLIKKDYLLLYALSYQFFSIKNHSGAQKEIINIY